MRLQADGTWAARHEYYKPAVVVEGVKVAHPAQTSQNVVAVALLVDGSY